ncbi:MAG: metalloregulator ArsR/SmtB family transcription factor [Spirochaetales bacterium]|nr:metalloregulator ArsR/SmtB family transcription factor [Spirochaetales bacterium]
MNIEKEKDLASSRARIMKALAHPTRIFMVELLSRKEMSVGELTAAVGADVSTVSKHLSLLKQEKILSHTRDGKTVNYSLICPCILEFIHCLDEVISPDAGKGSSCSLVRK